MTSRRPSKLLLAGFIALPAFIALLIVVVTLALHGPRTSQVMTTALSANRAALFATFQSQDHRLAYSPGGIFMSYFLDWNTRRNRGISVIVRSTDGGSHWTRILTVRIRGHSPATLDTDSAGNVYALQAGPLAAQGDAFMYVFPRSHGYTNNGSNYLVLKHGYSGKYTSAYDAATNRLLYANWYGLYTVTLGSPRAADDSYTYLHIFRTGDCGETVEYPLLYVDRSSSGLVLLAYTATKYSAPQPSYYEDRFIVSTDNGATWQGKTGTISRFPFNFAGCDGPSWLINEPSQITGSDDYWWLDNAYAQGRYLLFVYSNRQDVLEYRRFRLSDDRFDVTIGFHQCLGAPPLCPTGLGAFFSGDGRARSRIYLTGSNTSAHKAYIWYSNNDGAAWHDYASTPPLGGYTYACAGMPQLGPHGEVMGALTVLHPGRSPAAGVTPTGLPKANDTTVYFFHTI